MAEASVVALAVGTIAFVQLAAILEEWIFKQLPGFDFYWTVALVELLLFTVLGRCGQGPTERRGPAALYVGVGGTLALGTGLGKVAYRHLNYATGTVLKSMKLVPVMVLSVLWLRRRYSAEEYAAAALMVASAALFGLGERELEPSFQAVGLVLSLACLVAQAAQSNLQDRLLRDYEVPVHECMLFGNGAAFLFVLGITVCSGELLPAARYFAADGFALGLLLLRSVSFYVGAYLYNLLMQRSGAVLAVAVTTLRKSLTVLCSFLLFPKPWSAKYGYGSACLAVAIALDVHAHQRRGGPVRASRVPPTARKAEKESDHDSDEGQPLTGEASRSTGSGSAGRWQADTSSRSTAVGGSAEARGDSGESDSSCCGVGA